MVTALESALQLFACAVAAIATLQAGKKALYAVTRNNEPMLMDGPLILSPFDVKELERSNEEADVSPLWEITFGFSEAVRLLRDADEENDGLRRDFGLEKTTLDEKKKESGFYSLASPHLSYMKDDSVKNDEENKIPINGESFRSNDEDNLNDSPMQSLVVSTPYTTMIFPKGHQTLKRTKSPLYFLMKYINKILHQIKLLNSIRHVDPMEQLQSLTRVYFNMKSDSFDDEDITKTAFDYDTIHCSSVPVPMDFDSNVDGKNTTSSKTARIKAFAPKMFQKLRSRFGIKEEDFIKSMLESGPYVSFQSNSKGAARAGGFFFFTRDGAYMVKTIKKTEVKTVLEMLPKYNDFMEQNAKRSLLTRFCGLYSVQLNSISASTGRVSEGEECVFLIMNSVFPAEGSKFILERFDLKGSTVGRECSLKERAERGNQAVLKDLDLEREVNVMKALPVSFGLNEYGISIGAKAKSALLSQLRKDLKLLVSCSVMDYSLLVGVVDLDSAEFENKETSVKNQIEKELLKQQKIVSLFMLFIAPLRLITTPLTFVSSVICNYLISSAAALSVVPFQYYDRCFCGVYGGSLSMLPGKRLGRRALYYIGVIDFLQPWTTQKVLEKELKGMMGYEKSEISCANPKDYAQRFLVYMDKHIT